LPSPPLLESDDRDKARESVAIQVQQVSSPDSPKTDFGSTPLQSSLLSQHGDTRTSFDSPQLDIITVNAGATFDDNQDADLDNFQRNFSGASKLSLDSVDPFFLSLPFDLETDFVGSPSPSLDMMLTHFEMITTQQDDSSRDASDTSMIDQSRYRARETDAALHDGISETTSPSSSFFSDSRMSKKPLLGFPGSQYHVPETSQFFRRYQEPGLEIGSRESMMLFFQRHTCDILSIKGNPGTNLWRTLIWPLAEENPALNHAVSAMTYLHMSKRYPPLRSRGLKHVQQSRNQLAIQQHGGSIRLDAALATNIALGFAETWDHEKSSTGFEHIQEARALVQDSLSNLRDSQLPDAQRLCLNFLANTWVYMDVIARLTTMHKGTPIDFEFMDSCINMTNGLGGSQVDPLMGCAVTLFPLIGRVADLVRRIWNNTAKPNSPITISQAVELMNDVKTWSPVVSLGDSDDSPSILSDSAQTAEAYRWATILLLHQAVPALPSFVSLHELAQKVLVYIATIPLSSGTTIVQIFPLLVAGCEIVDDEERDWVRQRWELMSKRMTTGIVDRCITVTMEVWKRRDQQERLSQPSAQISSFSSIVGGATFTSDELTHALDEEDGEVPLFRTDFGKNNWPSTVSQRSSAATKPIAPMNAANISTKLQCARNTVNERLQWLGVMRDWNWQSEYPDYIYAVDYDRANACFV
jgi:hypothetical protein